jgi:hypothetical protein
MPSVSLFLFHFHDPQGRHPFPPPPSHPPQHSIPLSKAPSHGLFPLQPSFARSSTLSPPPQLPTITSYPPSPHPYLTVLQNNTTLILHEHVFKVSNEGNKRLMKRLAKTAVGMWEISKQLGAFLGCYLPFPKLILSVTIQNFSFLLMLSLVKLHFGLQHV